MSQDRIEALSRSLADSTSRRSLLKLLGAGVAGTAVTAVGLNEALAKGKHNRGKSQKQEAGGQNLGPFETLTGIPITEHDRGLNFKGQLDITNFVERNGGVVALGILTGKVTGKGVGNKSVRETVELPVQVASQEVQTQAICQILDLTLGPIDLNLLGLRLQVNQIHIRLTADSNGGLLGSLLCGLLGPISGLPLLDLLTLLNAILALLSGL